MIAHASIIVYYKFTMIFERCCYFCTNRYQYLLLILIYFVYKFDDSLKETNKAQKSLLTTLVMLQQMHENPPIVDPNHLWNLLVISIIVTP